MAKRTLLLIMVLLAIAAWAVAQQGANSQSAPSSSSSQEAAQPSSGSNGIEGCLGGSGDNLTVTDKGGNTYQLQLPPRADISGLKQHIGEEVRVKGTVANAAGSNPSGGSAAAGQPSIQVTGMEKLADSCGAKTPGAKPKGQ